MATVAIPIEEGISEPWGQGSQDQSAKACGTPSLAIGSKGCQPDVPTQGRGVQEVGQEVLREPRQPPLTRGHRLVRFRSGTKKSTFIFFDFFLDFFSKTNQICVLLEASKVTESWRQRKFKLVQEG